MPERIRDLARGWKPENNLESFRKALHNPALDATPGCGILKARSGTTPY
jgi:hypothetical protein